MMISFIEAKRRAEKSLVKQFEFGNVSSSYPYLSETFLEEINCWMFFKHKDTIEIPIGKEMVLDVACVVSKLGNIRIVGDLSHDFEEAKKYNKEMSDFERIGE